MPDYIYSVFTVSLVENEKRAWENSYQKMGKTAQE